MVLQVEAAGEQFVAPLAELFDRTAGVFDCGNLALARDAYRKLFDSFAMDDDYGRGIGIFLVVLRPFKVGDFISAGGITGAVEAVGLFVTKIDTPDNICTLRRQQQAVRG